MSKAYHAMRRKAEELLGLAPQVLVDNPREAFLFILGREAKRVARLELVAQAARKVLAAAAHPRPKYLLPLAKALADLDRHEKGARKR